MSKPGLTPFTLYVENGVCPEIMGVELMCRVLLKNSDFKLVLKRK